MKKYKVIHPRIHVRIRIMTCTSKVKIMGSDESMHIGPRDNYEKI